MELENFDAGFDLDWDDDVEQALADDDYDAETEFEAESMLGQAARMALNLRSFELH